MSRRGGRIFRYRWEVLAGAAVFLFYSAVLVSMPRHVFWSPDEGAKFLHMLSLGWQDGPRYEIPYAGRWLDPDLEFFLPTITYPRPSIAADGTVQAEFYTPVWFPLVSRLEWEVFGIDGIYLLPLLSGWLIAVISGALVRTFDARLSPLTIILVGVATPVCFYSLTFWEHTAATLCALVAVFILVAGPPGRLRTAATMAIPLLLAMMLRIELMAFAAASALTWLFCGIATRLRPDPEATADRRPYSTRSHGSGRLLIWGLLIGAVGYLFAVSVAPRHDHLILFMPKRLMASLEQLPLTLKGLPTILVDAPLGAEIYTGYAPIMLAAVALCLLAPFLTRAYFEAAVILPALSVVLFFSGALAWSEHGYRSMHGIFSIAPYGVVAAYTIPHAWRARNHRTLTLCTLAFVYLVVGNFAILYAYARSDGVRVGLEWGQRYILTLYPLLALLSVAATRIYLWSTRPDWLKATWATLVGLMMLIGFHFQARGVYAMVFERQRLAVWEEAMRSQDTIVTDLWWLPASLAPSFARQQMFFVDDRKRVAEWVERAAQRGVSAFTLATVGRVEEGDLGTSAIRRLDEESHYRAGLRLERYAIQVPTE